MIRFFGKQNKAEFDSTEARLRSVEWKVNVVLAIVGIQLLLTIFMIAKDLLFPSTMTIALCSAALIAAAWVFRKQIPGLIKRLFVKQMIADDVSAHGSSRAKTEDSIQ